MISGRGFLGLPQRAYRLLTAFDCHQSPVPFILSYHAGKWLVIGPFIPSRDFEHLLLEHSVILLMLPVHQVHISNVAITFDAPKWGCLMVGEAQSKPFGFVKDGKVSAGNFQRILN